MIIFLNNTKNTLFSGFLILSLVIAQDIEDLSFGGPNSLDIATWNIEWFPKNDQITIEYLIDIISQLDLDILAIQEIDDTTMFDQMLDSLTMYTGYYQSSWFAGLAYIYKTSEVEVNDVFEIYTTSAFWNAFPRSPMVMDFSFNGYNLFIINNHFKCCGDGIIDFNDSYDEENRRFQASNLIKEYIDNYLYEDKVIVLGDLNDDIAESLPNNVFQDILEDTSNYYFADIGIAQGISSNWSFPNWPSHLDHILITNELFNLVSNGSIQTIKIDEYLDDGWSEYDQNISDHRPVGIKLSINLIPIYDIDNNGTINESDIEFYIYYLMNEEGVFEEDINNDNAIDIFDLLTLCDFLQG